jgi:hypothetical protein
MGRYKITKPQLLKGNFEEKEKLVTGAKWAPDTRTDKFSLELVTRYYFLSESCCVVSVGLPL